MYFSQFMCIFLIVQIFHSTEGSTITRSSNSDFISTVPSTLPPESILSTTPSTTLPKLSTTLPEARQILTTDVNIPISTDTSTAGFPSTQTTAGATGIDLLRRGSELVADRIVSALSGIATLIDVLRNTSSNGDVAVTNLGSSTQLLTNRLLRVGMSTASTLLQELNGQLGLPTTGSSLIQRLTDISGLGTSQGSILRSTPLQIFFPYGVSSTTQGTGLPNFSGILDSSVSTTRPGLNTLTPGSDGLTENFSNGNTATNVAAQVETILGNVPNPNSENIDITF